MRLLSDASTPKLSFRNESIFSRSRQGRSHNSLQNASIMNETIFFGRPTRGDGIPCWRLSYSARAVHPTFLAITALLGSYKSKIWIFACIFLASGLAMATTVKQPLIIAM